MRFNFPNRNTGCRISDEWTLKGLKTVVMENELLRIVVLADKGSDIYEFNYKPLDVDFMWRRPGELRNPYRNLPTSFVEQGPFTDFYAGGWQEMLPSGSSANIHHGIPYGQHGEVCNVPWRAEVLTDTPETVQCRFSVRPLRTPIKVEKVLTLHSNVATLFIEEEMVNESPELLEIMWGHHIAIGEPFLNNRCRIDIPARKFYVHPQRFSTNHRLPAGEVFDLDAVKDCFGKQCDVRNILSPESSVEDMGYFMALEAPWTAITDPKRALGLALTWNADVFRYVWYWQQFGGGAGYPWFGRAYTVGLEPWSSLPKTAASDKIPDNTHLKLPPFGQLKTHLYATVFHGLTSVQQVDGRGRVS